MQFLAKEVRAAVAPCCWLEQPVSLWMPVVGFGFSIDGSSVEVSNIIRNGPVQRLAPPEEGRLLALLESRTNFSNAAVSGPSQAALPRPILIRRRPVRLQLQTLP